MWRNKRIRRKIGAKRSLQSSRKRVLQGVPRHYAGKQIHKSIYLRKRGMMSKKEEERTGADDLLAEMGRSAIAGLRKETPHKSSPRKREAGGKRRER